MLRKRSWIIIRPFLIKLSEIVRVSWGCVSAVDFNGRAIFVADAHRDDGKRFVVRADEKLTAFLEIESAVQAA
jgi:hypothetical protein